MLREYPTVSVSAPRDFVLERTLITADGVRLRAGFAPGVSGRLAVVLVHGFNATITTPANLAVLRTLIRRLPVVAVQLRGHGSSQGLCTLGDKEVMDVAAAVAWARTLGFERVATLGFSMGASIVVRHAGLLGGVDGVVAVSGPAFWNYRGTPIMRRLHFGVENPFGRRVVRHLMGTRVIAPPWPQPWPVPPVQAARQIPPTPFLVVHGAQDGFFPQEHPQALRNAAAAGAAEREVPDHCELWVRDFGHAEAAIPPQLLDQISAWVLRHSGRAPN